VVGNGRIQGTREGRAKPFFMMVWDVSCNLYMQQVSFFIQPTLIVLHIAIDYLISNLTCSLREGLVISIQHTYIIINYIYK